MPANGVSSINRLLEKARQYLPPERIALVEEAYQFAKEAHEGQVRLTGEPYVEHPVNTALILAELQLDASSLAAALLHDIPEDCGIPIEKINKRFGMEVGKLVDGTTKLGKVSRQASQTVAKETQAENLRKMLVAMAEDLRVVFIKLADRLNNMHTLYALEEDRRLRIARETLDIYAPLASRLGIWELKWQLEDLSFSYLEPTIYQRIAKMIATRRAHRESFIKRVIEIIEGEFEKAGLRAEVSGRPKHIYSIYRKMERYADLGKYFDDILDRLALRVVVDTIPDCYSVLGVIHSLWRPLPEAFDDYISQPKSNGYQSLHTVVMSIGTTPLEVQIRTREMHYVAENGVAAHWRYKEGDKKGLQFEERIAWLRQLIDWHRDLSGAEEFLESVKTDIFIDQVFVYTPQGEIKDLPQGSTPLDFAYRVHTELGHRCTGAKVNGKLVPLTYQLKNGDVVEISAAKVGRGPSRDWLNPHLGFIKTSHAKEKIRQWFKKQERTENVERGRQLLERELKRLGLRMDRAELAELFNYSSVDDFLAAIGYGGITTHQIPIKLAALQEPAREVVESAPPKAGPPEVRVLGVGNLVTHLAQCCKPVPGDRIIGYITRSRGVTVHRQDCHNIINEDEPERLIPVEWGPSASVYQVTVEVQAWDRVGLVHDMTAVVAEEKINITSINVVHNANHAVAIYLTLGVKGLTQLSRILAKIEGIRSIINVSRIGNETATETKPPAKVK